MNKIYKVIWSKVKHQYVVVSELAHRDGKRSSTATTSKATWRALAAALMLTGSLAAMPYTGYAATGAETTSGQYIAVAVDSNNNSYKTGWWGHQETHYYKAGDTRTFEDANGDEHEYTWVSVDGKDYWVREGYSITIAESNRFDAYDENNNHIAPDKSYVIDSQKGENADDSGLISSSQVLVTDDKKHTTLTGNELNKIDAGIYGGAVNTGGTQVPVDYHYYIDDNGNGYINVGKKDNWSDFENSGHFKRVYYNEEKGVYQTTDGITVSSEYLYAIDGTSTGRQDQGIASDVELGAFFNSDGTVYTGKVYGHNNEVLMTGYDEATDKYYSYWGTQISDRKMSLANLTVGNLLDIKDGLEGSIYTAQGDDIKQVSVQKAQGSNNGGTIGFIRRGDYVGDDAEGNPIYKDTAPVPGTITIRNTDNSGKEGNDVAIRFGSIDEHGQDVQKFTVDAGSKVEGKIGESIATVDDKGQTLDGISINGVDYKLGGGKTYSEGKGIDISDDDSNTISVDIAENSGLHFEGDKLANDLKVTADENGGTNGGNWTVTDSEQDKTFTNTTLKAGEAAKTPINGNTYGNTYTVEDTDGNQVTLDDVASASSLKTVAENSADINLSNLSEGGKTAITNLAKGVEKHIEGKEYKVSADGTVTMSYVDGNGESVSGEAKITGLATKDAVDNAAKDAKKHTTVKLVEGEGNLTLAKGQNTNEGIEYTLGLAKALNVDSVNAGGTVIDSKGLSIEKTTYVSADGLNAGKKVITNVADGKADSDAVNYGQLKNYVGTNATYKSGNGIAINNDREISVALAENSGLHFEGGKLANDLQVTADENGGTNGGNWTVTDSEQDKTFTNTTLKAGEAAKTPINGNTYGNTYTVEDTDGNQVTLDDVASASKLKEVAAEVGKHTSMTVDGGKAAGTAEYNGGNLLLKDNGKDGQHQYDVKLNDDIYLGGNQTADNRNIALEGSTGSIHAATTEGNNTFDFDSNGGKFETTTVDDSLLVDKPWIGKNGIVTTTTNTSEFNQSGATFTKTGKVETYLGDQVITTTLIPKTFTNIDGSKITSDAGVLGGQTVVDGGSVTVQGAGSVLGTHTTTVEGSKITSVGTWGSLLGDTTEIDGAYINAGGIEVNGEPLRDTITGLSNTEWKNDEAWQKTHIRDDRAATEGQLQDVADSLSGDVSKLDDFAVKYDEVNGKPDYSTVTLEGTNGTKITNLAKGEVTATSTDAVNGSQLFEVQELAGKHTTMTVNNGMVAPEDGSYTTDGNLQLKQKVGDKGQIEYDVKLNDNLVLGKGDSQITLNGAPTDENAPAISVGEVFTVGQDGSVHAAVAGDSTSDSMSFTNGGLTISNMSGDVSSATVIKGADIQAGGIHLDGTDKIIAGLSNTTWTGMTTTPDKAATEGQLQMVSDTVASGWTATDDKDHKINVNPNTHPTLNFASGKNITVSAENDEINVALNDNVYLGEDNAIALEGSTGHISATVKYSLGMSTNTLTFDDKGLTVSKDAMGVGSGSTNIIGDMITTTDENGNETTIDGGKVTTEALEVKGNSDNTMTFDAKGLNVNTGDAQLNVSEDRLSLNVDNGAGRNNSVKITQDGTTFSYSENGVTGATTTVIQGQKITAGDVLINGEDGKNTITGLTNTTWKNDAAWQADNIVADRAATEGQLQKAAAAATTTVSEGKNIDVTKTIDKEDGHTNYEVALQDNVSLGDGTILLNGVPKDGDALLNVDNKLVVEQDGTTTITVNDGTQMGDNTTVTVGADGVTFAGYGNGNTVINGQTIQAGGVFINDGGNGEITRLTNTTLDDPTFATVGRAATEEQLKLATDAATTTVSEGKNIDVNATVDKEDGHTNYEVSLEDNIELGDGKIMLNGAPEEGDALMNVDDKLIVAQDGTTTIAVNDGTVMGDNTTVTVGADGVTFEGYGNGSTIINGQTIQAGGIFINDGGNGEITRLTNTTLDDPTFATVGRAATEEQLQLAADAATTTLSNGKNTTVTSKTAEDGHVDYQVNLNDHIVLGDQDGKNNNISINGNEASIILNGFENGEYKNSIEIDAASGTITGLTNAIGDGKDGWETFTDKDTVHGSRAVTEDDLYEVYRHGVQYGVSDDGSPDYTTIVLANPYNSDTKGGGTRITNVAYATGNNGSEAVNVDYLKDQIETATTGVTKNEKHIATNVGNTAEMPNADYSVGADGKVTLTEVDGNGNKTGNSVVISDVASASDLGDVDKLKEAGLGVDEKGNSNVVDAILDVDNKVGDLNYNDVKGDSIQNGDDTTTAIGKLDNRIDGLETDISGAAEEAKKHNTVEAGSNIVVTTSQNANGGTEYKVSVDPNLKVDTVTTSGNIDAGSFSTGDITINKDNSGTINGLSNTTWNKEVADAIAANANGEAGTAATQGQLQQAMNGAVQYDTNKDGSVNKDSITLGGSTYDPETHKGGTTITNVADGKNASDAVNMNQLWQTNQAVINNSNNISMLSNSVNKLDNRIDRVGAGAAALAALHPLDFDPDAKWDFAAGYGNYRGANAVAVGAYYRPNEDVMFSVGGSMGGGENMVNAGVSLKIGAGNSGVTTSRVAMAKEIKAMRDVVAKQDAQIQKLTAMVNALVGVQAEPDTTTMFPDVPENHWAYEAVASMAKSGLVEGYPDGEFKGDRTMTRYEFAQIIQNAIQKGAEVDARLVQEFKPELEYFHIATVAKDKDGNPTIERVRAN